VANRPARAKSAAKKSAAPSAPTARQYQAPALEKGLDILELLSGETEGLGPKDIATKLGRSVSEIFRMLVCLEERDYIFRETASDTFKLSLKLFELGLQNPPTRRLVGAAAPALFNLSRVIQQSCHVAIHSGGNVMVVAQQNSPEEMFFTVGLGATVPIQKAVSGIVLLSYQTAEVRAHWLEEANATKAELGYLKRSYPSVLKRGYFKQDSKMARGVSELALPVFGHTGSAVATVSVPIVQSVSAPTKIDDYLPHVRETAFEISRQIGWHGEIAAE
jgi:DNA-binding IclR family transcriptional regulator